MFKSMIKNLLSVAGFSINKTKGIGKIAHQEGNKKLDEKIIDRVFDFFDSIGPFYENIDLPEALEIGGAWRIDLIERRKRQLQLIKDKDIKSYYDFSRRMFYNELIKGMWSFSYDYEAKFIHRDFISDLNNTKKITACSDKKLFSQKDWDIWGYGTGKGIISYATPKHYVQAYNINNLVSGLKHGTENKLILDLGSGFGGMANILADMCKQQLKIVLVDIPLNLTTAFTFLSHIYGLQNVFLIKEEKELKSILSNSYANTSFFLLPTSLIPEYSHHFSSDIVHNAHSFSEMDKISVDFYLKHLIKEKVSFFLETNSNVSGSVNTGNHIEVLSRDILLPEYFKLLSRYSESSYTRYVTSLWSNELLY